MEVEMEKGDPREEPLFSAKQRRLFKSVLSLFLFWVFVLGVGMKATEKTSFEGIRAPGHVIKFEDVRLSKLIHIPILTKENIVEDVWVRPEKSGMIRVKVDTQLTDPAISIAPTFFSMAFGFGTTVAKEVVIWTPTEKEKLEWEEQIKEAEETYFNQPEEMRNSWIGRLLRILNQ